MKITLKTIDKPFRVEVSEFKNEYGDGAVFIKAEKFKDEEYPGLEFNPTICEMRWGQNESERTEIAEVIVNKLNSRAHMKDENINLYLSTRIGLLKQEKEGYNELLREGIQSKPFEKQAQLAVEELEARIEELEKMVSLIRDEDEKINDLKRIVI